MKKLIIALLFMTVTLATKAQFEQKVTMQLSTGYSILQGDLSDFFSNGITLDGGLQYNFNRNFSLVALIKYGTYFINNDVYADMEGKYNNLGISICPKYKFFNNSQFTPYVFGGININYIKFSYDFAGQNIETKEPLCFGYLGGMGAELKINDNISLFSQLGYSQIKPKGADINSIFIQLGININMFKSKSL